MVDRNTISDRNDGAAYACRQDPRPVDEIAARSKAQSALRRRESDFQTLFEESPLGMSLVDETYQFVAVNPRLCDMLGYTAEELVERQFTDLTHADDLQVDIEQAQQLLAGEIPRYSLEKRYIRKDGSIFWVRITVSLIRDEQGRMQYYVGMVEDIDARKQVDEDLRKRNRELQLLNRLIGAASAQLEPRVVLETACRELAQALNMPRAGAALITDSAHNLEVVAEYMSEAGKCGLGERIPIAGNPATQAVMQHKQPLIIGDAQRDPRMAPVHHLMRERNVVSMMLLPLQVNGEVVGTIGLDTMERRDFSAEEVQLAATAAAAMGPVLERAQLHAAKETQARQMQQIVDSVPVGLLLLDEDRRVVLANSQARAHLQQAGHFDEEARLVRFGDAAMTTLMDAPSQHVHLHEVTVGEPVQNVFEIQAAAIEGAGWAVILHDVTVDRDQARRLQAQERLAAVGQLSAGIAHDFNNILGVIIIYLEMLQRETLPATVLQRLAVIHEQAQRAAQLVEQILDFSRKAVMRRQPMTLVPFLEEQVQLLARTMPDRIHVELQHEPGTYMVDADATRLQQIMINLALNARDAMPHGGLLRVALSRLAPGAALPLPGMSPGDWIRLEIADGGAGIEPQHLEHIFEPFFTTKAPGQGSGLGLSQVYGIVRQHEGYIDVQSTVGQGTTFTIYLPGV